MTPRMRDALTEARKGPLRRVFDETPGKPGWPAPAVTLHALVRHGLLERSERRTRKGWKLVEWTLTDAGREALEPTPRMRPDRPLYLARGHGTTTNPLRSIDTDQAPWSDKAMAVEVMVTAAHVVQFSEHARGRERERRAENGRVLDGHSLNERLERARLAAREHRMDFAAEERLIRHMVADGREQAALQRLVRLEVQLGQRAA